MAPTVVLLVHPTSGGALFWVREMAVVVWKNCALAVLAIGLTAAGALAQTSQPVQVAQDSCSAACRNQHNQCRVATKGAASCDAQLTACLQRCIASKSK